MAKAVKAKRQAAGARRTFQLTRLALCEERLDMLEAAIASSPTIWRAWSRQADAPQMKTVKRTGR